MNNSEFSSYFNLYWCLVKIFVCWVVFLLVWAVFRNKTQENVAFFMDYCAYNSKIVVILQIKIGNYAFYRVE
jgi:hypothetical protein